MLEPKTAQMVNELIQGMTRFCINSYKFDQQVHSDDIKALAELINSVNVPPEQLDERGPVVGFIQNRQDSDGEDE